MKTKKDDIGYFSISFGLYPRVLYVTKGNVNKKVYRDNFMSRNGDDLNLDFNGEDGSCTWSVIEKNSNTYGYLVRLHRVQGNNDLAHEATHVALELFRDIGAEVDIDNQEPFAYLVGWIVKQLSNVYNYKDKQLKQTQIKRV